MTALEDNLSDYLALRRALGFKLSRTAQLLEQFVAYLDQRGEEIVTITLAVEWATPPAGGAPSYWAYRLSSVRGFARYLHTLDPVNDVPPTELLPYRSPRLAPYLYSDEQIAALMTAAGRLRNPKRALSYQTIIGLLATTGMRVGEALRLDLDDVHWEHRLLLIRNTKFGKWRLVPLAASTFAALGEYVQQRKRCYPVKGTPALFLSAYGTRVSHCSLSGTFHQLTQEIGVS
ncbi:MAG: tyrosine-type recombinase/integrase [Actinobacteria bacterium]|nr:tyrosine-type recombinase/integrase [Actinomycetota bacterium]